MNINASISHKITSSTVFETSLGWVGVSVGEHGVVRTTLPEADYLVAASRLGNMYDESANVADGLLESVQSLLIDYCEGEDAPLVEIPIDHGNASEFTRLAREACRKIPRGETRSYGWLAQEANGNRRAARAAGRVMATNPLPLIVPCHRVIGSNGKLHGFGGSVGLPLKARLLQMEGFATH